MGGGTSKRKCLQSPPRRTAHPTPRARRRVLKKVEKNSLRWGRPGAGQGFYMGWVRVRCPTITTRSGKEPKEKKIRNQRKGRSPKKEGGYEEVHSTAKLYRGQRQKDVEEKNARGRKILRRASRKKGILHWGEKIIVGGYGVPKRIY